MTHAHRLRELLAGRRILVVPGAADAITARVIERAGFPAVYATGAGFANASFGLPDVGLVSSDAVVAHVGRLADVLSVPVIADADTGFGGVLNVHRTVRQLERAGAAAIQLEDQVSPKRCGHFDGKAVVARQTMLDKLAAALDSRDDPDLVIIARTDAYAVEGFEASVERAQAYAAAGADMIFVEAPRTVEELRLLPGLIDAPLVANMVEGGKTPLLTVAELGEMGFRMALYANTALRVAVAAVQRAMESLRDGGGSHLLLEDMISWDDRQSLVGLEKFQQMEDQYLNAESAAPASPAVASPADGGAARLIG
jgi:2-methylisocitrate lyase-like PEP mutase family enzyme